MGGLSTRTAVTLSPVDRMTLGKDQNTVRRMVGRDGPLVLTVSPPCTLFSIANQSPLDPRDLEQARELMSFAVEMCYLQLKSALHSRAALDLESMVGTRIRHEAQDHRRSH